MTKEMPRNGKLSLDMMYLTAGTQINIDYKSEEDFKKKFKVISYLTPLSIGLFSNSAIKENQFSGGSKIVFCHFRSEMDKLEQSLNVEFRVEKIDGRCSKKQRNKLLLRRDIDVLLIQIQTGCEGLNLQQYNEVYFTSPHWNPAVEDQAIARAHRIGQTKKVKVYRFLSVLKDGCSLDSYCKLVQEVKRDLQKKYIKVNNRENKL